MEKTFPEIESEKIGDYPAIRVVFAEKDATMWFLSKAELFAALEQRMEQRRLTKYQLYEIALQIETKDSVPAVFKEKDDATTSFLVEILEKLMRDISIGILSENPYSPQLCIKKKIDAEEPVWRFSGPNICSDPFANKKVAEQELFEMKGKGEISADEYVSGLSMLMQRTDIPLKSALSKKYNA